MRVMDELTESHKRTPSFHHAGAQSPRVGGCVGAFFHMFDWNPSKRFSSTKRITADRPNHESLHARRDRSFTERTHTATSKLSLITEGKDEAFSTLKNTPTHNSTASPASVKSDDLGKRVPGVVARLMGLESMPDIPVTYSSTKSEFQDGNHAGMPAREQLDSPPVLLQELLRQEFHQHCKRSLKDKLPGFTKKQVDLKPVRGTVSQIKKPRGYFGEHAHPHGDSRSPRPARSSEKKASFIQEGNKALVKRPFLARLQTGAPTLQPSKSLNSNSSPLLSPSMLEGKNTVRLLEAAVKVLELSIQPSPKSRHVLTRETHRDTQSDSGGSFRSEKRSFASNHGRGGSPANSSTRSLRSQSISRTWSGRDDRAEHSGHESSSPGTHSFRTRHESSRQDQTSRRRLDKGLVASTRPVSPLQTHRSRISKSKSVEGSPQAVLGTHEASIRGFKIDLGNQGDSPQKMKLGKQDFDSKSVESEALSVDLSLTSSRNVGTDSNVKSPEPGDCDQNADVKAVNSQGSPSISKSVTEKSTSSGGYRSIRFRSRGGKQEKDVGGQGNRVFPSDKHAIEKSVGLSLPKAAKVAGAGFSYSMLFSSKKQGNKKEGGDKGEVLIMKRTDSSLMRSLLRRPGSIPVPTTKSGSQCSEKKSGIEDNDVDVEKVEPAKGVICQASSLHKVALEEPELSPTHNQLEKTKDVSFVQARYRSIDDVFPELPLEENDVGGASPDLGKTIQALEEQFLGFGSQGETASLDCRSIERMFGKGFSRSYVPASPTSHDFSPLENLAPETSPISPEAFVTDHGVPGTFPNSPSQKYEIFSSRSHLNLQDMFEVLSGDCPHDLAGRRRSFCLSEPRERVLDDEEAGADLDTCCNSAVCDTGGTPDRLEIQKMSVAAGWSEDVVTPPALKKFEEKLAQGFSDSDDSHTQCAEECGQPSPVSVLYSPFLDEVPTTPDASFAESQQTDKDLNDIDDMKHSHIEDDEEHMQETKKNMSTSKVSEAVMPVIIETCMIKQAILDISRFRNIDISGIGLEPPNIAPVEPQQEQNYIREVLDAANLLREGESGWYSADSPMNKSLFDRLEFGSIKLDERMLMESKRWGALPDAPRQGSGIRSERKLLFDCVNEVMALQPWMKTSSFCVDLPMFPDMHLNSKFRSPISGEPLVKEVYRMICHWRDIAGNVLDDLIDYDMNVPEGRWVDFSHEVAVVGLDIERTLLKNMIGEIVDDLASILTARALSTP